MALLARSAWIVPLPPLTILNVLLTVPAAARFISRTPLVPAVVLPRYMAVAALPSGPAVLDSGTLETRTVPLATVIVPLNVFAVLPRLSVPLPVLVRFPEPLMTPVMVGVLLSTWITPLPLVARTKVLLTDAAVVRLMSSVPVVPLPPRVTALVLLPMLLPRSNCLCWRRKPCRWPRSGLR